LKLKENNYEAAEIEFLITAGREGLGWGLGKELAWNMAMVLAWKCLQIN